MKLFLSIIFAFSVMFAAGQKKVSLDDLKNNSGVFVEVRGKVKEISKTSNEKEQQVILYVGGNKPNEKLTIHIKKIEVGKTDYIITEKRYLNAVVIVKGYVVLQEGKPRILITSPDELIFLIDELIIPN